MLKPYAVLLRRDYDLVLFGALASFLSSPGQTYFIALFVGSFAASFRLDAAALGSLYLAATLGAAMILPLIGHWIDRVDLRIFTAAVMFTLAGACLAVAGSTGPAMLFIGILLLRLTGQGLMTHIEVTSIARHFGIFRGRALSLSAMGFVVGEATLPALAVMLIASIGWRESYFAIGLSLALFWLPLMMVLLTLRPDFARPLAAAPSGGGWRSLEGFRIVGRTRFFWLFLPLLVYVPFTSTALTFHIEAVSAARGWSRDLIAGAFTGYAVGHAMGLLGAGPLVDRLSARAVMPFGIAPLLVGIGCVAGLEHWLALFVFLVCMGATAGLVQTAGGAIWAEVYGLARLGAIRSTAVMVMVAGTAAGPAMLGGLIEAGIALGAILAGLIAFGILAAMLATTAPRPALELESGH